MSSYFDRFEQSICDAVERRARRRWYSRLRLLGGARPLAVLVFGLVVAAPAVGAVTNWYGFGAPDRPSSPPATVDQGRALPGTATLLPLRVADPQGGPPWSLQLVHTTRGDTCIQLGRVEDGRLGSLGIDDAWHDDRLFHPFAGGSEGADCGTTDAAGHGFVNVAYTGVVASADLSPGGAGEQSQGCEPPHFEIGSSTDGGPGIVNTRNLPPCPNGSTRIVFMGLLGPDATSITYQSPSGALKTEPTSGSDGAYLLVFSLNASTCHRYLSGPTGSYGPCGSTELIGGDSPDVIGAVKSISYRDGHVCTLGQATQTAQSAHADPQPSCCGDSARAGGGASSTAALPRVQAHLAGHLRRRASWPLPRRRLHRRT